MDMIRYDFQGLDDGHAGMMAGAVSFTQHSQDWSNAVKATVMTWLSQDGQDFDSVNQMFAQAEVATNDFLSRLGSAVQTSNANAQETLGYCRSVVNG
jgi:uncharacterized protein YukE